MTPVPKTLYALCLFSGSLPPKGLPFLLQFATINYAKYHCFAVFSLRFSVDCSRIVILDEVFPVLPWMVRVGLDHFLVKGSNEQIRR